MTHVRLTAEELEFAALAGALRRTRALARGLQDRYGTVDGDPWSQDVEGVAAEMAVAKVLGRYYVPALNPQRPGAGDVGPYEVRSTTHDHGCLLVKDGDPDDRCYILVTGRAPALDVRGWLRAADGKRQEWRRDVRGRQAWFVPQDALHAVPIRSTSPLHAYEDVRS